MYIIWSRPRWPAGGAKAYKQSITSSWKKRECLPLEHRDTGSHHAGFIKWGRTAIYWCTCICLLKYINDLPQVIRPGPMVDLRVEAFTEIIMASIQFINKIAKRLAMNNCICKVIHSHPQSQWCTCDFELFTLFFARLMQSTVHTFYSFTIYTAIIASIILL